MSNFKVNKIKNLGQKEAYNYKFAVTRHGIEKFSKADSSVIEKIEQFIEYIFQNMNTSNIAKKLEGRIGKFSEQDIPDVAHVVYAIANNLEQAAKSETDPKKKSKLEAKHQRFMKLYDDLMAKLPKEKATEVNNAIIEESNEVNFATQINTIDEFDASLAETMTDAVKANKIVSQEGFNKFLIVKLLEFHKFNPEIAQYFKPGRTDGVDLTKVQNVRELSKLMSGYQLRQTFADRKFYREPGQMKNAFEFAYDDVFKAYIEQPVSSYLSYLENNDQDTAYKALEKDFKTDLMAEYEKTTTDDYSKDRPNLKIPSSMKDEYLSEEKSIESIVFELPPRAKAHEANLNSILELRNMIMNDVQNTDNKTTQALAKSTLGTGIADLGMIKEDLNEVELTENDFLKLLYKVTTNGSFTVTPRPMKGSLEKQLAIPEKELEDYTLFVKNVQKGNVQLPSFDLTYVDQGMLGRDEIKVTIKQ